MGILEGRVWEDIDIDVSPLIAADINGRSVTAANSAFVHVGRRTTAGRLVSFLFMFLLFDGSPTIY